MSKKKTLEYLTYLSKCPVCKQNSCGDQKHILSKIEVERNVGDLGKILLEVVYQMVEYHNLQVSEIKALFSNIVDEHIQEEDLND